MDPITITLIVTTCAGAVSTILVAFRKSISKIKCCFGSEVDFREDATPVTVSPNQVQGELTWPDAYTRTQKISPDAASRWRAEQRKEGSRSESNININFPAKDITISHV